MGKDMLKLPNNKWGFLILLVLEALIVAWALVATFHSMRLGRTSSMVYGMITLLAVCYILGRSIRTFLGILKKEREEQNKSGGKQK